MAAPKVKICGLTNLDDALLAVQAGADAVGFVFAEASPRFVPPPAAQAIIRRLPPFVAKVGVFVNPTEEFVRHLLTECGVDTLQFHGDEPPGFCRRFAPWKVIKAFRVQDRDSLRPLTAYPVDAWLLDSYVPGQPGGAGTRFNWDLAREVNALQVPILLAGGLTPDNVAAAVRHVQPWAVDVASGVEASPGKKDPVKLRQFIQNAKGH